MDKRLHWLDSFEARGSDGRTYQVRAYEHLVRDESLPMGVDHWEPTGLAEYRLADGARVEARPDGKLTLTNGVELAPLS
jgi:hypothetical protein